MWKTQFIYEWRGSNPVMRLVMKNRVDAEVESILLVTAMES
jgi:hypothetical protein